MFTDTLSISLGIMIFALNYHTLREIYFFYAKPGSIIPRIQLLNFRTPKITQTVALSLGIIFILYGSESYLHSINISTVVSLLDALLYYAKNSVLEECLFRVLPWLFLILLRMKFKRAKWVEHLNVLVALSSALLFGWAHMGFAREFTLATYVDEALKQTIGGLIYWYLIEKNGVLASSVVHIFNNSVIIILMWLPQLSR